jgi:hypothetical protein
MARIQAMDEGVAMGKISDAQGTEAPKRAGSKTVSKAFCMWVATPLARATTVRRLGRGLYRRVRDDRLPSWLGN